MVGSPHPNLIVILREKSALDESTVSYTTIFQIWATSSIWEFCIPDYSMPSTFGPYRPESYLSYIATNFWQSLTSGWGTESFWWDIPVKIREHSPLWCYTPISCLTSAKLFGFEDIEVEEHWLLFHPECHVIKYFKNRPDIKKYFWSYIRYFFFFRYYIWSSKLFCFQEQNWVERYKHTT